jgi:hypothetical protein
MLVYVQALSPLLAINTKTTQLLNFLMLAFVQTLPPLFAISSITYEMVLLLMLTFLMLQLLATIVPLTQLSVHRCPVALSAFVVMTRSPSLQPRGPEMCEMVRRQMLAFLTLLILAINVTMWTPLLQLIGLVTSALLMARNLGPLQILISFASTIATDVI